MDVARGQHAAVLSRQVAGRRRGPDHGCPVAQIERAARRRIDAHMGHEPGQDKVLFSRRLKPVVQIRADEGIGLVFDDQEVIDSIPLGSTIVFKDLENIPATCFFLLGLIGNVSGNRIVIGQTK